MLELWEGQHTLSASSGTQDRYSTAAHCSNPKESPRRHRIYLHYTEISLQGYIYVIITSYQNSRWFSDWFDGAQIPSLHPPASSALSAIWQERGPFHRWLHLHLSSSRHSLPTAHTPQCYRVQLTEEWRGVESVVLSGICWPEMSSIDQEGAESVEWGHHICSLQDPEGCEEAAVWNLSPNWLLSLLWILADF